MTASDHDQPPRQIQQRLALERRKNLAIYQICYTTLFAVAWTVIMLVDGGEPFRWIIAAGFAVLAIVSVFSIRNALRALRAFDDQRAADIPPNSGNFDAGTEKPLG
ncbi:hypothetical protein [Microbacterium sp. NPDC087665]|uniref:hypothetical protein n=1 Tax=Microbacterium sp. NPDC087665 TaxID=3364194 RepID=UPI003814694B